MFSILLKNRDETLTFGKLLGSQLKPGSVVGLIGELGTGKTVLAKSIASSLGIEEEVNSPTFVILNEYMNTIPLYHLDVYRLNNSDELKDLGYEEYFYSDGITVVEWADKIVDLLPLNTIIIELQFCYENKEIRNNERIITVKGNKQWVLSFKNLVEQALQT